MAAHPDGAEMVRPRMPVRAARAFPAGAWDCHAHVFGPFDRFPAGPSTYALPDAPPGTYLDMLDRTGVTCGMLVQPAPYGTDSGALENAVAASGGRAVGVATASADCPAGELERLRRAGVLGLRFNERIAPATGARFPGAIGTEAFRTLAPVMRELGLHAQLWAGLDDCVRLVDEFAGTGVPIVLDHLSQPDVAAGPDAPGFRALLDRVRDGAAWVKLTLCRVGDPLQGYADARPFHDALVETAASRLLWGSDWPFVRLGESAPDVADLADTFCDWVDDAALRRRILVENPPRLLGIKDAS
ncbi:2-pyrone-4,6-dicarboxylic acid hydrolase [Amycolatopsis mediterranei S699]|uniref:2-pyrone-4,6-dicarboxylic acid hydrolase n=2 Tax=Amycolatopsis mediterranei TaxID=33910 RepID=A0A9R0P426_AMYMS|nr:amidohydrolase family protein [Amycolatopsis mediterranei]ADJ48988.1 putative 2-pyrone-4,6-dicarboxylic acid hydrolase [Amycolatopsis mediterranei U32]AEK45938.1 2-pyrone-4,6-dicarboxylic acid hydrolase [Amycolatopsis mediterranei S699]AFO80696.1 2-pyrone-4,6-dicarboxylic acid hydrolase [Amycolatopsis mediterranei S699]AGT87824.1 2-pyrone-4,6-dicarboxylic acid hydrolase [Amycolatopsis mediterranei RB]KDU93894.1 2-pyrone-4,6-dicarboxylate hydrolase [Amycolatopsis mediterranei]